MELACIILWERGRGKEPNIKTVYSLNAGGITK
jgi:hypothetical protein